MASSWSASGGKGGGGGNGGAGKSMPPSLGLIQSPSTPSTSGSSMRHQPPLARSPTSEVLDSLDYMFDNLSIVVVGASGDLAKKKVGALALFLLCLCDLRKGIART